VNVVGSRNENRVIFFDNLRCFFVLCVVLQHAANADNSLLWWPVSEENSSMIAGWLSAFFDAFTMPLLFMSPAILRSLQSIKEPLLF